MVMFRFTTNNDIQIELKSMLPNTTTGKFINTLQKRIAIGANHLQILKITGNEEMSLRQRH